MNFYQVTVLAIIQGLAELLPVSSSAHVIVAEKWMGIDPSLPQNVFILILLHFGTLFSVGVYFWKHWWSMRIDFFKLAFIATVGTGLVGIGLKYLIESFFCEIEQLFKNFYLISIALACSGLLIVFSGRRMVQVRARSLLITKRKAFLIGLVQGFCLPFRGLSRSGATLSTAFFLGVSGPLAESFSFLLAFFITPPVLVRQCMKLQGTQWINESLYLGLFGMFFSFLAGLLALYGLSRFLNKMKWQFFGYYCFFAAGIVFCL